MNKTFSSRLQTIWSRVGVEFGYGHVFRLNRAHGQCRAILFFKKDHRSGVKSSTKSPCQQRPIWFTVEFVMGEFAVCVLRPHTPTGHVGACSVFCRVPCDSVSLSPWASVTVRTCRATAITLQASRTKRKLCVRWGPVCCHTSICIRVRLIQARLWSSSFTFLNSEWEFVWVCLCKLKYSVFRTSKLLFLWLWRNPNHLWPKVPAGLSQLTIGQHAPQLPAWHPGSDQPSYKRGHQQQNPSSGERQQQQHPSSGQGHGYVLTSHHTLKY